MVSDGLARHGSQPVMGDQCILCPRESGYGVREGLLMERIVVFIHEPADRGALQNDLYRVILFDITPEPTEGDHGLCHVVDSNS
jgi:hypothetical protein